MHTARLDRRYHSIDFAKGICILFVIVTHFSWQEEERLKYLFPFWIAMAVPLFMIISGFVSTKSFQKNKIDTIDKAYTLDTLLSKIIRFGVPFTIAFCVEELIFHLTGTAHHNLAQIGLAFLNGGFGPGSYYTPLMIQFIFYFPIIYAIIRKYEFKGLILCGFINFTYELLKFAYEMNKDCYRMLIFRYTLVIAFGCYLAMGKYKKNKKLSFLCICIGIGYIILFKYMGMIPPITNFWTGTSFWACLYIIPISVPLLLNNISNRFIEMLGRASYNIFLVQMIYYQNARMIYPFIPSRTLQLITNIIVCVFVGLLFYYIETPITKKILITLKKYRKA